MRYARFLLPILATFTAAGCCSAEQSYAQVQYEQTQPRYASPAYPYQRPQAAQPSGRGLFNTFVAPAYSDRHAPPGRFRSSNTQAVSQQPRAQPSVVMQYRPLAPPSAKSAATHSYAYAPATTPYTLDSGDKLRVVVFGQDGITGSYLVDAGGNVTLPLIGSVPARGRTTKALAQMIAERLKQGYIRQPHVTVSIEAYRPFFILGEVTTPGQYPYVANMTAENAVAIAGGFSPRAFKGTVKVSRNIDGQQVQKDVPLSYRLKPGDTVVVKERWF